MSDATDEVLAAQASKFAAQVARDGAALEELLAENLSYIHSNGKVDTKRSFIESVATRGYVGVERKDAKVRIFGEVAVVTGRAHIHVHSELRFDAMFTDIWVRQGSWRNVSWQSTVLPPE